MRKYKCNYCGQEFTRKEKRKYCCKSCANKGNADANSKSKMGEKNPMYGKRPWNYKGTGIVTKSGSRNIYYKDILVNKKRCKLHRIIMEFHLGRKLEKDEVVHHIDGNGLNNELSNLKVMDKREHNKMHRLAGGFSAGY